MKLISVNDQTTVISNLTEFQNVLSSVDFVIDETPQGVFKDFSFAGWLAAANLSPSATFNFINNKNVYRTDGLVNVKGYSGKSLSVHFQSIHAKHHLHFSL